MGPSVIDKEQVLRIAALAEIHLEDSEVERLVHDLARILEHVGQLAEVSVKDTEPTAHVLLDRLPLRLDEPAPSLARELALGEAPRADGGYFVVPPFVDQG